MLSVGGPGDTLTVLVLFGLIGIYSCLGGIRGVILTDLFQFALALAASVLFAWFAVDSVGGMDGLLAGLAVHYDADQVLAFVPSSGAAWLPLQVFFIYLSVQWWAQFASDGSGYLAQRLFTAKSDAHAEAGGLWFAVANYGLRTWPWVLIGLVGMVAFAPGAVGNGAAAAMVADDPEMAYPVLMAELLPTGLLGILFASLLAAFMSTVDTHLNWGASYLVNDVYHRFLRPEAGDRELVRVSRAVVFGLVLLALAAAARIESIEQAWRFLIALGAGLGLPSMLRWLWWRVNAWTEIAGIVVATSTALVLYPLFPDVRDEYLLLAIVGISVPAALAATLLTPPVPMEPPRPFRAPRAPARLVAWTPGCGLQGEHALDRVRLGLRERRRLRGDVRPGLRRVRPPGVGGADNVARAGGARSHDRSPRPHTHARARGAGGGGRGGCLRREPVNGAGTSVRDVVRRRRGLELVATGA